MGDIKINSTSIGLSTGAYSRLSVKFFFQRNFGFYFTQIYLPSVLLVMISWVAFWVNRESAPARVLLGITTVLTMTTIITTTNSALPPVSYIKAVDIYLGICYFMVVAALLEYAVVGYGTKKVNDRIQRKKRTSSVQTIEVPPDLVPPRTGIEMTSLPCTCPHSHSHNHDTPRESAIIAVRPGKRHCKISMSPNMVDRYSRVCFPSIFLIVNALYWFWVLHTK